MSAGLSATMVGCIDDIRAAGGEFVRHQGGFWAPRGPHPRGQSAYHGTPTINAIVARGYARYTEYRDGRNGRFPIAVELVPDRPLITNV